MRIGILSDTHDQVARTIQAVDLLRAHGAETLIHCGDITTPDVIAACSSLRCHYVMGNNDFDVDNLRAAIASSGGVFLGSGGLVELGGKRIAVAHGDLPHVVRRLGDDSPDYLLSGHTHLADDRRQGATRWINPGALSRAARWTAAVLDLDSDRLHWIEIEHKKRH